MKLKNHLKDISQKNDNGEAVNVKQIAILIIAFFMIIVTVCTSGYITERQNKANERQQELILVREAKEKQDFEKKVKYYYVACANYNIAVDNYNIEAERINNLVGKLSKYNVLNGNPRLELKSKMDKNFNSLPISESEIAGINGKANEMDNKGKTLEKQYGDICRVAATGVVEQYNLLAKEYNDILKKTSIDFIKDLPSQAESIDMKRLEVLENNFSEDQFIKELDDISEKMEKLSSSYFVVDQITAPEQQWVIDRIKDVKNVTGQEAVSKNNDPNRLLGKDGGYSSCIYFTVKNIDSSKVAGNSIVAKGTDAGGAIEVYPNIESAKTRCEYLSGFDNTLLYSGSYVLVGTMVIRTSYKLSDKEQVDLTNEIIEAFTMIDN